jgi:hypothetical protein
VDGEPRGRRPRVEAAREFPQALVVVAGVATQGRRQLRAGEVEALALCGEQGVGRRQGPGGGAQLAAAALEAAQDGLRVAPPEVEETGRELGPHRHHHLGGARRRRRAHVGGVVDQGPVGLVADR